MTDLRRIVRRTAASSTSSRQRSLINAALYGLVVYPLSQRVASGEQEAGVDPHARSGRRTVRLRAWNREREEGSRRRAREVLRRGAADLSGARRILYPRLDQLARKTNLTPGARFHPEEGDRTGDLRKITMTMNLTGEYSSVRRFIHELETAPEFLVLESVAVATSAEGDRRLKRGCADCNLLPGTRAWQLSREASAASEPGAAGAARGDDRRGSDLQADGVGRVRRAGV